MVQNTGLFQFAVLDHIYFTYELNKERRRMKILMISSLYPPNNIGGAEKAVQILSEGLAKRGHSIMVITTQPTGLSTTKVINGVRVYYVPVRNIQHPFFAKSSIEQSLLKAVWHGIDSYNPWMAKAVQDVIETEKVELVHTHNLAGFSVATWTVSHNLKLPIVHTLHDHYLLCPKSTMFRNGKNCTSICVDCRFYAKPRQLASLNVNTVVGVSAYILNRHLELRYFSKAKQSQVIFNPYIGPHHKKMHVVQAPVRFGYLGRIHPIKGIENLIKAFTGLANRSQLLIGGTGDDEYIARLKQIGSHLNIKWLGYVNPQVLLENIDVLVVPSLVNETAAMVIQEALAVGIPVLSSKRGGMPEVLGDAGWLFDPDDPQSLISILTRLIQHPDEISSKCEQAWQRGMFFSVDSVFQQYESLYRSL